MSAGHAFASLRIWIFALSYMTGTIAIYAVSFWLPTIVQSLGIPPGDYFRVGLLSMIPWTVMIIMQVLWGRNSDRTRERRWHSCAGNAMAAIGLAMLAVWPQSPVLALTGLSLVTAGCGCSVVTFWPMPQSLFAGTAAAAGIALIFVPVLFFAFIMGVQFSNIATATLHPVPEISGVASAIMGSTQMLGAGLFVWLGGWLFDGTPATIGYGIAIGSVASCALYFAFGRRHAPDRR